MDKCPKGLTRVKVLIIGLWFCREFQAVVHRSAWLWLQRILLPSCNSWFHVPGMNDSLPVFAEFCLLLVLILSLYGYREVTSRTTMELVASPFMATSLRMRTSAWNTPELAACQWPMLAPTPTVPSSSSAQPLHHGECQIVNGRESWILCFPDPFLSSIIVFIQAGRQARCLWAGCGGPRRHQESGGLWFQQRQDQCQDHHRWLWPAVNLNHLPSHIPQYSTLCPFPKSCRYLQHSYPSFTPGHESFSCPYLLPLLFLFFLLRMKSCRPVICVKV